MSNRYEEAYLQKERLRDINYFCEKNSIILVWQGPKYVSKDFFF